LGEGIGGWIGGGRAIVGGVVGIGEVLGEEEVELVGGRSDLVEDVVPFIEALFGEVGGEAVRGGSEEGAEAGSGDAARGAAVGLRSGAFEEPGGGAPALPAADAVEVFLFPGFRGLLEAAVEVGVAAGGVGDGIGGTTDAAGGAAEGGTGGEGVADSVLAVGREEGGSRHGRIVA
jgi:hypothetical protein